MGDSTLFGRKAPVKAHLVRGSGGLQGEVQDLRSDIDEAFEDLENGGGYFKTDEFTDPAAPDTDAIKTAAASAAAIQTFTAANGDFDGVVGAGEMDPPRNLTITTSLNADIDAVAVVIDGFVRDKTGREIAQQDTITLTDGGNATDAGTKAFSRVTQAVIPAQSGPGGTVAFGFGGVIGLSRPIKARAGLLAPIREVAIGAVVTTGTFVDPATDGPNGTYAPAAAPNGSNDYAVTYEVDPSA